MMESTDRIATGLGEFSKAKFNALINVREAALDGLREFLKQRGYSEVTTASLVNIAGSCENPHASFMLNYYGKEAHLSQSAQIQLETIVLRLRRPVFTINNSFREENFIDPETQGRRLSEFTLVEPERPYNGLTPEQALDRIIEEESAVIKHAIQKVIANNAHDIGTLGGNVDYVAKIGEARFERIRYDEALELLNKNRGKAVYRFGDDLGIVEERELLRQFGDIPLFVNHYPAAIKFFNMKRTPDGKRVYCVDLLMPKLGETIGGAVREEHGDVIKQQLRESKVGTFLQEKGLDPITQFPEYFPLFEQEPPLLRGGYGIGFERFVAFLLGSNDILETIAYRPKL